MLYNGANGCGNGAGQINNVGGRFDYPTHIMAEQDSYYSDDVGLTHPINGSFIRINRQGEIIIHVQGMDIHMNASHRRVTFHAKNIKILAKSIFWNKTMFSPNAFSFKDPLLQPVDQAQQGFRATNNRQNPLSTTQEA